LASTVDYCELVGCPTLALFGPADVHVPVERSVLLLGECFEMPGNDDPTAVVCPEAGPALNDFMPSYWETVYSWPQAVRQNWGSGRRLNEKTAMATRNLGD